jgi:hypothetical protein
MVQQELEKIRNLPFDQRPSLHHFIGRVKRLMKRICFVVACVFTSFISLARPLGAAQTNVTVLLTNQCQVTGFLVSQSASNVVVSVGGGQRMTFAYSELLSLDVKEIPPAKSRAVLELVGGPPASGGTSPSPTRIMLALTNGSLLAGVLVSQSSSNFVVSTGGGQNTIIARGKVNWFELKPGPAVTPPGPVASTGLPALAAAGSNSIAAEFNKPHTEDEMRAMLRTPEGAALIKSICGQYIGSGADPQTKAASEAYFKTVQEFEDGKLGIVELQGLAQATLGNLSESHPQTNGDPRAPSLDIYKQILQGFIAQPPPIPVGPVQ